MQVHVRGRREDLRPDATWDPPLPGGLSLLCLCDPPREGFSKASVSLVKPFSQGLCKASARDPSFCSIILVKGYSATPDIRTWLQEPQES